MLERAGYTADSVPKAGEVVPLRSTANLSTGGTATDVTDIIHPDNRAMAVRAVRAIGLDVGGVDFLSTNIAESYKAIGGGICEVNAAPGFRMHVAPSEGTPRDAAGPVIDMLFPPGTPSARADRRGHRHQRQDHHLAHARAHRQDGRLHAGPDHHRRRLHRRPAHGGGRHDRAGVRAHGAGDPQIDFAVLETARGGLVRAGMGVPRSTWARCSTSPPTTSA
jgi:cyanophycin synthetase